MLKWIDAYDININFHVFCDTRRHQRRTAKHCTDFQPENTFMFLVDKHTLDIFSLQISMRIPMVRLFCRICPDILLIKQCAC